MQNYLCPFDQICGTNNYVLLATEQLQTYGVKNNLFTNNSICAYSFQLPSSAVDGDALYIKVESLFNAEVEINQSKDFVEFGQAYTLRAGSFVNINSPMRAYLIIKANAVASGYAYFSFMFVTKANLNGQTTNINTA